MKTLDLEVWSDIACPWCYVGKRRLEAALAKFPHRDAVRVTWRAFELDPEAPRVRDPKLSQAERLAAKYGRTVEQAQGMLTEMTATAAKDGLDFHFEKTRSGNTFDAHRLIHFATERGRGDAMKERLLRAYMTEGEAVGEVDVLVRLAGELGFVETEVRAMLASDENVSEVRKDEADAQALGIRGVPCFVIDRRFGVSGAQPPDALLGMLHQAWAELSDRPATEVSAHGESCGPEGCA